MSLASKIPSRFIDFGSRVIDNSEYTIGIKRVSQGGGAGTWVYIDESENVIETDPSYFTSHPVYAFMDNINDDISTSSRSDSYSNEYIGLYKFFVKSEGASKFWISYIDYDNQSTSSITEQENNLKQRGFVLHPAFYHNGYPLQSNYILIGKYQAAFEGEKIVSKAKKNLPTANVSFDSLRTSCLNLNQESSGDVPDPISSKKGYHMMTIQEYSALCLLSLIEYRTTNLQLIGTGNVSGTLQKTDSEANKNASFHGITGLWGNAWQFVDGIKLISKSGLSFNNTLFMMDNKGTSTTVGGVDDYLYRNTNIYYDTFQSGYYRDVYSSYNYEELNPETSHQEVFTNPLLGFCLPNPLYLVPNHLDGTYSDKFFGPTEARAVSRIAFGGSCTQVESEVGIYALNFDFEPNTYPTDSSGNPRTFITTRLCKR